MSIDFVGDFLTILRNASMVSKPSIVTAYSNMRHAIAAILKEEGFIDDVAVEEVGSNKKIMKIKLRYKGESAIHEIKRVSTPGCRVYSGIAQVRPVIGNLGISILSTNRGVMSHKKAKQLNVGGEIICTVW